jgi:hypothetical protein
MYIITVRWVTSGELLKEGIAHSPRLRTHPPGLKPICSDNAHALTTDRPTAGGGTGRVADHCNLRIAARHRRCGEPRPDHPADAIAVAMAEPRVDQ